MGNNSTKINQENHSIPPFESNLLSSPLVESDKNAKTCTPSQDFNAFKSTNIDTIEKNEPKNNSSSGHKFKAKKFDKEKFKMANQRYIVINWQNRSDSNENISRELVKTVLLTDEDEKLMNSILNTI